MTPEDFVNTARGYIGTPFKHQGRLPHVALDCAGLVICAARECGIDMSDRKGYSNIPDGVEFKLCLLENAFPVKRDELRVGDLMTFAWTRYEQHVAIVSSLDPMRIIHSWYDAGKAVENGLDEYWARRLRGCFRLRVFS